MKLLAKARQQADFGTRQRLGFGAKGNVQRRQVVIRADLHRALDQGRHPCNLKPRAGQKPPPGGGGKGNGDLQFGVIPPARPLPGVGPVVVEYILALRMRFGEQRCHRDDLPADAGRQIARLPA